MSQLMAQMRPPAMSALVPLLKRERTWSRHREIGVHDPKATLAGRVDDFSLAEHIEGQ